MQKQMARTDFSTALYQIAKEKNLDPEIILDSIRQAIIAAYKKDFAAQYNESSIYSVELDANSGESRLFETEATVEEHEDGSKTLTAAKNATPKDITPPGFGRIAAQTARQVIIQKIREAEKHQAVNEYEKKVGSLTSGLIIRFIAGEAIVDIGKTEAVLPKDEQIHSEDLHVNSRSVFFIKMVRESTRGREIVLSRSDNGLILELFKREVPEVAQGNVEIRSIARDPGFRTKIAVYSRQSSIDPVGTCVGQKGIRVQSVMGDLGQEKIDIVQFSDDPYKFIPSALSPATGVVVTSLDNVKKTATVTVPNDQLSLAIGREGTNARLAGKLTNFHIDIVSDNIQATQPESQEIQSDQQVA